MNYRHIIIAALAGCFTVVASAQTQSAQGTAWGDALLGIVHNNSTLKAARSQLQASRLANGTTLKLPDPEA